MKKLLVPANAPVAKNRCGNLAGFAALSVLLLIALLPLSGYSQNPAAPLPNTALPTVHPPAQQTPAQGSNKKEKKQKEKPKSGPAVVPPDVNQVPVSTSAAISEEVYRFFDKKADGFYIKSMTILFLDKAEGVVYVTGMDSYLKYSKSMTGGGSSSSSAMQRAAKAAMASLKKERNTARVTSGCWGGDPANTLFHGKTVLSTGRVCRTGCDLKVIF